MIFKINKKVTPPQEGIQELLNKFYDVEEDAILGVRSTVDIREWSDYIPDDALVAWKVYKNSIFIVQYVDQLFYLKVLTPTKTYIYHFQSMLYLNWYGSFRPYSSIEVLDETTVIFGPLYIDLENLILLVYEKSSWRESKIPLDLLGYVPYVSSVKKLNNSSWVYSYLSRDESNNYVIHMDFIQKTSFMDCLGCENRKKILQAIGADERLKDMECEEKIEGHVRAERVYKKNVVNNKDLVGGFSVYRKMEKKAVQQSPEADNKKCIETFKKMSKILNRKNIGSLASNYNRDLTQFCSKDLLKIFVEYIELFYTSKHTKEYFFKNMHNIDYDDFFNNYIVKIGSEIIVMLGHFQGAINDYFKFEDMAKEIFRDKFLLVVPWLFLTWEDQIKPKYYNKGKNTWTPFNPYKELSKYKIDSIIALVLSNVSSMNLNKSPFKLRRIKVSKTKRFNEEAEYVSMGPIGCLSITNLSKDLKFKEFDNICDTEMRFDELFIWHWKDINANIYAGERDLSFFQPVYKITIYCYNYETREMRVKADYVLSEKGWFMMPNKKMAVYVNENEMYIRDFYFDGENIKYVEYKKPFTEQFRKIFKSKGSYMQANLNTFSERWGTFAPTPFFPYELIGGDKKFNMPFYWEQ